MEKIVTEIYRGIKEKASNPFFRYFAFSWIIYNYKFLYILMFQDENISLEKYGMLKIDYLSQHSFHGEWYYDILFQLILPLLSAYILLYWYPKLNRIFLKKYKDNKNEDAKAVQEFLLQEIDRDIEKNKRRLENSKTKLKSVEIEHDILEKIDEIGNKDYIEQYNTLKDNNIFQYFGKIIEYSNLKKPYKNHRGIDIPEEIISKYIGLGLLVIDEKHSSYISLTDNGREMAKIYLNNN